MNTSPIERNPASFRDPTGFVYRKGGKLCRAISERGKSDFTLFLRSGLAGRLIQENKVVPFQRIENQTALELRELGFITYPYEWSFGQLRDAALLTLELADTALEHDMILQDATAFNVAFENGRPIFMDHGSFRAYHPGEVWCAYRQFIMHFLAPLLLMKHADLRCLDFFRSHVEGFPLDFASRLLPWRTWLKIDPLIHVHLHARMEMKYSGAVGKIQAPTTTKAKLHTLFAELKNYIATLSFPKQKTEWVDYYSDNNYSETDFQFKKSEIERICQKLSPHTTIDLGANTGVFSEIAAGYSRQVIAADIDPAAVEALYRLSKTKCPNIIPVLQDLNNPTPGIGMFNRERCDFYSRCHGELVMGLALIHHLRISGNWPLPHIVKLFADMTADAALVEFVPRSDSQVQRLLRSRNDIFDDWTLEEVVRAFREKFSICNTIPIPDSGRVLLELYL
ncbi:MAG: SAM-dependent methyltransferase [Lentisphaeria bacterium]|nr:SAM-dependent methyltransferase [Lentisphaeria bacterium]